MVSIEQPKEDACLCLRASSIYTQFYRRLLGVDTEDGRYADVSLFRCNTCDREWLFYQLELEFESRSGRWFRGLLAEGEVESVQAYNAAHILESLPWYFAGGSYFGGKVYRTSGPLPI